MRCNFEKENKIEYKSGYVKVDKCPKWLKNIGLEEFYDKDFIKIITFFVFNSPVPGRSARHKSLQDYGWENPFKNERILTARIIIKKDTLLKWIDIIENKSK